jgi:hypothetical protein
MRDRALTRRKGSKSRFKKRGARAIGKTRKQGRLIKSAKKLTKTAAKLAESWGAVYVDEADFAEIERCIQTPQQPTQSIVEGAEQLRRLYGQIRS